MFHLLHWPQFLTSIFNENPRLSKIILLLIPEYTNQSVLLIHVLLIRESKVFNFVTLISFVMFCVGHIKRGLAFR